MSKPTDGTTRAIVAILHLRAPNDASGNPRRVYVGLNSEGHIVRVTDEYYGGRPKWVRDHHAYEVPINVIPRTYREFMKLDCVEGPA